jgi:hypothetical protein
MSEVRIFVDDDSPRSAGLLLDWLRREPELRGAVTARHLPGPQGSMGALAEVVVALGSSGAAAVLARSVHVWLTQRRSDVSVIVSGPGGRRVHVEVKRVAEAGELLNQIIDWVDLDGDSAAERQ